MSEQRVTQCQKSQPHDEHPHDGGLCIGLGFEACPVHPFEPRWACMCAAYIAAGL